MEVLSNGRGYGYYRAETEGIRQEKYEDIAIGELKARQVQQWRKEKLANAPRPGCGEPGLRHRRQS